MSGKLGEILIRQNLLTPDQLKEAVEYQRRNNMGLTASLVQLGLVSEPQVTVALSKQYGVPAIDFSTVEMDESVTRLVPREVAQKYCVVPVARRGATLTLAMADPANVYAMDDIKFVTGFTIEPVVASEISVRQAIERGYGGVRGLDLHTGREVISPLEKAAAEAQLNRPLKKEKPAPVKQEGLSSNDLATAANLVTEFESEFGDAEEALEVLEEQAEIDIRSLEGSSQEAPVVRLVNVVLVESLRRGASDIHIEPYEREFRVRFRIDGILYNIMNPPLKLRDALISRLKIMSKLDISEKRLPQDGRIKIKLRFEGKSRELDFRVSSLPTLFGEKVVLRLLDKEKLMLDMTKLGFEPSSLEKFKRNIEKPYGMCLVTGPTGSGKTNTLYSALQSLNTPETNIMTAEDPVEFNLAGINQVQIKDQIGLNFAAALRSFLRQDPNIILVGEIRDFETAEIAVKASLTGHMVLSTLHTNDAPSTVSRLMNMGIEPFLVATSVNLIQAQRLIRRVCANCKDEFSVPPQALMEVGFTEEESQTMKLYKGKGCERCNGTGYKGRVGLYEVMEMTDSLRELILVGASNIELRKQAIEEGMITLRGSGLEKVRQGITTIEEVIRETVK
ncbi:MAG TPA: type IV-A pilus assembly ATPase PilB [Blastocatellia bacterium]|nr:type IV-A pilus assembly ATPase PilB [Blastocatellia bacterium]